jgi:hypothetical protein
MPALKAHVRSGRIVVDEPTNLPEGTEIELEIAEGWDMDPTDLAELEKSLARSAEDVRASRVVSAEDFLARLGKRR